MPSGIFLGEGVRSHHWSQITMTTTSYLKREEEKEGLPGGLLEQVIKIPLVREGPKRSTRDQHKSKRKKEKGMNNEGAKLD